MKFKLKQCRLCKGKGEAVIVYHYNPSLGVKDLISTSRGKCYRCNGKGWDGVEEVKDELP